MLMHEKPCLIPIINAFYNVLNLSFQVRNRHVLRLISTSLFVLICISSGICMLLLRHVLLLDNEKRSLDIKTKLTSNQALEKMDSETNDNKVKRDLDNKTLAINDERKKLLHSVRKRLNDLTSNASTLNVSQEIVKERPLTKSEDWYFKPRRSKVNLNEFKFMISGKNICKESNRPFLLVLIMSVHSHMDMREAIRKTWGSIANTASWPLVGNVKERVKLVFLFGKGRSKLRDGLVEQESKLFGDVVQADFVDSYFNLTRKILTGIRWISMFCPGAKFVLKADEDVFVHIPNLIKMLKDRPAKLEGMIYGHTHENATVLRKGKWAVEKEIFPFKTYPTYTCGNTYVLSGNIIRSIYNTSQYLPFLNIEDVFVTGITRKSLNIPISHIHGFTYWYQKKPKPCEFKNSKRISATRVDDTLQYSIWEGLKDKQLKDCYKLVKRKIKTRPENTDLHMNNNFRDDHIYYNSSGGTFYVVK